jgi:hypothetical protein
MSQRPGNILGYFGWYITAWVFSLIAAGISFACRLLNWVKRDSFLYIFISVSDFSLCLFGIVNLRDMNHLVNAWVLLLLAGLLIGALMLADTYIMESLTTKKRTNDVD